MRVNRGTSRRSPILRNRLGHFDWGSVIFTTQHPSLPNVKHVDTFIVSQAPDMIHAIPNDVRGRDDLPDHAGLGGLAPALAC